MFDKLGISLAEQERLSGVAVDAIVDSVSVATTFKAAPGRGRRHLLLVLRGRAGAPRPGPSPPGIGGRAPGQLLRRAQRRGVLRRVVLLRPGRCRMPDGALDLLPHQRRGDRPVRADAHRGRGGCDGQLPRGVHRADARREPAPRRGGRADRPRRRSIKYSTVQNWYPGDADGKGGIYNFVTKRGRCQGARSKISWTQVETGSAITWKYPSVILQGDDSVGEFYSVAVTTNHQQADTGTKMIHIGRNTSQHHPVQGDLRRPGPEHLPGPGQDPALRDRRPQPHPVRLAAHRRPSAAPTPSPTIEVKNDAAQVEHEASTSQDRARTSSSTAASAA